MVKNKTIKILTRVLLILIMILTLASSTIFAANTLKVKLSRTRYIKNGNVFVEKDAYLINSLNANRNTNISNFISK